MMMNQMIIIIMFFLTLVSAMNNTSSTALTINFCLENSLRDVLLELHHSMIVLEAHILELTQSPLCDQDDDDDDDDDREEHPGKDYWGDYEYPPGTIVPEL
jgi:hypothetical protein